MDIPRADPEAASHARRASSPAATVPSRYGLRTDGVEADVVFARPLPPQVEELCLCVVTALGRSFPMGHARIVFDFYTRVDSRAVRAHARLDDNGPAKVALGLVEDIDWADDFEMLGKVAYDVFHEVFLHALPDLRSASLGVAPTSEQSDHDLILMPPDDSNAVHRALKEVLFYLPGQVRQGFLDSYVDEVEIESRRNPRCDTDLTAQRLARLNAHLNNPDGPYWRWPSEA